MDLLWGQTLYKKLRFVLVIRENGAKAIFVSTNLNLSALEIIEAYCIRYSIEVTFRSYKQQIGGFFSRFWTLCIPALDRCRKSTDPDELEKVTDNKARHNILDTLDAYERFAVLGCIAMGFIQMIAASPSFSNLVRPYRWLRTDRGGSVSEATVMWYLSSRINEFLHQTPKSRISQIVQELPNALPGPAHRAP